MPPFCEFSPGTSNLSRCTNLSSFNLITQFCFFQFPSRMSQQNSTCMPNTSVSTVYLIFYINFISTYCILNPPGFQSHIQFKTLGHKTNLTSGTKFGYEHIWPSIDSLILIVKHYDERLAIGKRQG